MTYTLTEKLSFNDNPIIVVKDKKIEVKADAETVLKLFDILQTKGETQATIEAFDLLFSDRDKKKINDFKLQFNDYITLMTTAISLALGENPDEEEEQGE